MGHERVLWCDGYGVKIYAHYRPFAARLVAELKAMTITDEETRKNETAIRRVAREKEKRVVKAAQRNMRDNLVSNPAAADGLLVKDLDWWFERVEPSALLDLHMKVFGVPAVFENLKSGGGATPTTPGGNATPSTPRPPPNPLKGGLAALAVIVRCEREAAFPGSTSPGGASAPVVTPVAAAAGPAHGASTPIVIGKREVPDWTPAELSSLAKALAKYPGGARNRWKMVADAASTRCCLRLPDHLP